MPRRGGTRQHELSNVSACIWARAEGRGKGRGAARGRARARIKAVIKAVDQRVVPLKSQAHGTCGLQCSPASSLAAPWFHGSKR
jgi:hypothetical protein